MRRWGRLRSTLSIGTGDGSYLRVFAVPFLLFAALILTWSLATPLGAGPDEPVQVARAAAVVRGQLVGHAHPVPGQNAYTVVTVPATFAALEPACYAFHPDQPAGCARGVPASRRTVPITIYVGHEPPAYYAAVGVFTFLPGGAGVIYLMRALGAILDAALLGLAVAAVRRWSPSPRPLLGVALATTPMVLFQSAIVNPSGVEIAAAIATWTALAMWFSTYGANPPPGLVATAGIAATILALVRPVSMVWIFVMLVALAPLLLGRSGGRELTKARSVQVGGAAVAAATVLSLAWLVREHGLDVVHAGLPSPGTSILTIVGQAFVKTDQYLREGVGTFGWQDTPLPTVVVAIWWALIVILVARSLLTSTWRGRLSLSLLAAAALIVPVGSQIATARKIGFAAQGRYFLPLWVGIPIVAACLWRRETSFHRREDRLAMGGIALIGVFQLWSFGVALHRFLVGNDGPIWPTSRVHLGWHPPVPGLVLDILALLVIVSLIGYLLRAYQAASGPGPPNPWPSPDGSAGRLTGAHRRPAQGDDPPGRARGD